jgi:glutathionylspermidine synthase
MRRLAVPPRPEWRKRAEELGFSFHTIDGEPYWTENVAYALSAKQVDEIEAATNELERLCLAAAEKVIAEQLYDPLKIPELARSLITESWNAGEKNLYGRFDLAYDGKGPPKLLEYNADTPTALYEASVIQWEWPESTKAGGDQFNSIHERLIDAWKAMEVARNKLHLSCVRDHPEDRGTVDYLRDTAIQAGLDTEFLHIDEIGWNGWRFVDLGNDEIRTLFKLYPWEWLVAEEFAQHIGPSGVRMIEPAWKMVLSNKGILALLWHMFPNHPNLLPATLEEKDAVQPYVKKPLLSREGANITLVEGGKSTTTDGTYGAEGFVYQAAQKLPDYDGNFPVVGSWVIASESAGIGIREDSTPITRDTSRFVPHFFD